jgi:hypothetical protein
LDLISYHNEVQSKMDKFAEKKDRLAEYRREIETQPQNF